MSSVIRPVLPSQSVVPALTSSSQHVLEKMLVEQPAQIQGSFSYATNNKIEFVANSPSHFLNLLESYIRFDVTTTLSYEGATDPARYWSEGGAHAMFRSIQLETAAGTLIQRIDRYNKFYSCMSSTLHSRDYVDQNLMRAGDSAEFVKKGESNPNILCSGSSFTLVTATGVITGVASLFKAEISVGDQIWVGDMAAGGESVWGIVTVVTSDTLITVGGLKASANITGTQLYVRKPDVGVAPTRNRLANVASTSLCFQPFLSFMQMAESIPVFLMRSGLRLTLELERPELVVSTCHNVLSTGFTGCDVVISNPYMVLAYWRPDESLAQQYFQMYKGDGLAYSFIGYKNNLNSVTAGSSGQQSLQIQAGVRSARHIIIKQQDQRAETISAATVSAGKSSFTADCVAQAIKANLDDFQIISGSSRFPLSKPLDCTAIDNTEPLVALEDCFNVLGNTLSVHRFLPRQWMEVAERYDEFQQGRLLGRVDSQRFILGVNLSRDNTCSYAGLDLTLNPLVAQMNYGASYSIADMDGANSATSALYIHSWIGHDATLLVGQDSVKLYI